MITGKQIENGTVTGADIKKETLSGKHLTDAAKDKLKGATATRSRRSTDLDPAGAIPGCPGGANVQVRTYDPSLVAYQDDGFRLILSSN